MFTGIVKDIGLVTSVADRASEHRTIEIRSSIFKKNYAVGSSVCVSGVCLTLVGQDTTNETATFEVGSETLRRTTLIHCRAGDKLNVEPSLVIGAGIDGHFVTGHVDCTVNVLVVSVEGETQRIKVSLPEAQKRMIAEKGSVTLDGVSLTVGEVLESSFAVYIFPHTAEQTTIGGVKPGESVNLEVDCIARYVARYVSNLMQPYV